MSESKNVPSIHPAFSAGGLASYRLKFIQVTLWVSLFVVWTFPLLGNAVPEAASHRTAILILTICAQIPVLFLFFFKWKNRRPEWFLGITLAAAIYISGVIEVTGGVNSPFLYLFFLLTTLSASYFEKKAFLFSLVLSFFSWFAPLYVSGFNAPLRYYLFFPFSVGLAVAINMLFILLRIKSEQNNHYINRLEAIYEASRALHQEQDSDALFKKLMDIAVKGTGAKYAAIRTFHESGALSKFLHTGLTEEEVAILKEPPGDVGVLGLIQASAPPVRLTDLTKSAEHKKFPSGHPPMKSFLGTPIVFEKRLFGKLYLAEKQESGGFTRGDEDLVTALAGDAALAIEKAHLYEKVKMAAVTDGLTGLFNYKAFMERLPQELERAERYGHAFSLIMVDIDDFKKINDGHGHQVGDLILKMVADTLFNSVRRVDICARYGGEEFSLILPETGRAMSLKVADRILHNIRKLSFQASISRKIALSASMGVSFYPENARDSELLIKRADDALYQAKRQGKNQVCS